MATNNDLRTIIFSEEEQILVSTDRLKKAFDYYAGALESAFKVARTSCFDLSTTRVDHDSFNALLYHCNDDVPLPLTMANIYDMITTADYLVCKKGLDSCISWVKKHVPVEETLKLFHCIKTYPQLDPDKKFIKYLKRQLRKNFREVFRLEYSNLENSWQAEHNKFLTDMDTKLLIEILGSSDMHASEEEVLAVVHKYQTVRGVQSSCLTNEILPCIRGRALSEESKIDWASKCMTVHFKGIKNIFAHVADSNKPRLPKVYPCFIAQKKGESKNGPFSMYMFDRWRNKLYRKSDKLLLESEKECIGFRATSDDDENLYLLGGEFNRCGGNQWNLDIFRYYEPYKYQYTEAPGRLKLRHFGIAYFGDLIYVMGGYEENRVATTKCYEIKVDKPKSSTVEIKAMPDLPEALSSPGACVHLGVLYVASQKLLSLDIRSSKPKWEKVANVKLPDKGLPAHTLMSDGSEFIYMTCKNSHDLVRFNPNWTAPQSPETVASFVNEALNNCLVNRVIYNISGDAFMDDEDMIEYYDIQEKKCTQAVTTKSVNLNKYHIYGCFPMAFLDHNPERDREEPVPTEPYVPSPENQPNQPRL